MSLKSFAQLISKVTIPLTFVFITGCAVNHSTHATSTNQITEPKIVIAHRGASGYLPEHSLAAKAMAYAMGADYIEQDVVMTKDNQLVVLHDPYLDRVTNVMQVFPDRSREILGQKRWLAIDFTLKEIKSLEMTEAFTIDEKTGIATQNYPSRFPINQSHFSVSTLAEEIELIQGLNHSTGKDVGIYVEIKAPWFYRLEGRDISRATLEMVKSYGYSNKQDKVYIQCFDPDETKRIHNELMPHLNIDLNLVQLIAETNWNETMRLVNGQLQPYSYDWMFKDNAMKQIALYADAIGPWKPMLVDDKSTKENLIITDLAKNAHNAGLKIHPYTFRSDTGRIPPYAENFDDLLNIFYYRVGVDGVFTDFPDKAVKFLQQQIQKQ